MSGHAIEIYLMSDGYAARPKTVCLEPPTAPCRLACPDGCEEVVVCGPENHPPDPGGPVPLHCGWCDAEFEQLDAGDCHIVHWMQHPEDDYAGPDLTWHIPVDIEWQEDGATWSLPPNPIAHQVQA